MIRSLLARCLAIALVFAFGVRATTAAEITSPVGRKIDPFTLKDYRGKEHSLDDFKSSKLVVVAFLGTECPLAKLYSPRLESLSEKYKPEQVAFVGIDANRQDSITEIAAHARIHGIKFPILKDLSNEVADKMGAVRTPEVFLLDETRTVRYWGRIDDQYGVGYTKKEPSQTDLKSAIDELLAGKPVEHASTTSVGCLIGRVREAKSDAKITYSNQIARIFQKRCVECHRDKEIAPFALTEYQEVAGWADMIAQVVREERMPPWLAAPDYGQFDNDCRLSSEEKETIFQWVADGAPEGDPKQLPAPIEYTHGWQLTKAPDAVFNMRDKPYTVQAEGTVKYQFFSVDPGFKEDKWVTEVQAIPGNPAVVHHILVFVRDGEGREGGRGEGARRGRGGQNDLAFLGAYVPGLRLAPYPKGYAKRIPAGSRLLFQMHYTPNGSEQTDLSKIGLVFADPKDVTHVVTTTEAIHQSFEIPPNDGNYMVESTSPSYDRDLELLRLMPHMHLRGKSFSYEAVYPDGKKEMLLDVPHYDFNWQTTYRLKEMLPLPKGTAIHCVAHFDNSEDNLNNPDPSKTVRWGDQTWEEMMIGFYEVAYPIKTAELKAGAPLDLVPTMDSVARRIIEGFDKNKDGKVSRAETPIQGQLFFGRLDLNKDGVIDVEEVTKALTEQQKSGGFDGGGRNRGNRQEKFGKKKKSDEDSNQKAEGPAK